MPHAGRCNFLNANFKNGCYIKLLLLVLFCIMNCRLKKRKYHLQRGNYGELSSAATKTLCMQIDNTLKARHKTCFLRPDTGPCRADLIQWYFDAKQGKCYRFFWGGCQGNGNKFENSEDCMDYCKLNSSAPIFEIPNYCSISFDYGSCFGHFYRWGWDKLSKTCKRYMYSGCGGNQNNFQSRSECLDNCLNAPNNTLQGIRKLTTCIPLNFVAA